MTNDPTLQERALAYHAALPDRIRAYLIQRGVPDLLIDLHLLGWNGQRITIPICNYDGELAFFKLAKDPADHSHRPKMLAPRGAHVELYGWEEVWRRPRCLIICEGEFDRLVLKAQGYPAVTSTGGAGSFREEWVETLQRIPELYICYDRDEAGRTGACKVGRLLPRAKLIVLPAEVGEGGDVTDFFVRLGRTPEDFLQFFTDAEPVPPPPEPVIQAAQPWQPRSAVDARLLEKIGRIKRTLPIAETIVRFVKLRVRGDYLVGLCPFHPDHTPSLVVYPATDTFHCYGCGKHGDVIDFVQAHEHLTFTQTLDALESVRRYYGREQQANN